MSSRLVLMLIKNNQVTQVSVTSSFHVMGSTQPHIVTLFPKEQCSCAAVSHCYHRTGVKMLLGLPHSATNISTNAAALMRKKRRGPGRKTGRKQLKRQELHVPADATKETSHYVCRALYSVSNPMTSCSHVVYSSRTAVTHMKVCCPQQMLHTPAFHSELSHTQMSLFVSTPATSVSYPLCSSWTARSWCVIEQPQQTSWAPTVNSEVFHTNTPSCVYVIY